MELAGAISLLISLIAVAASLVISYLTDLLIVALDPRLRIRATSRQGDHS